MSGNTFSLVTLVLSMLGMAPGTTQPIPRGPEVAVDPNPAIISFCPLISGGRDGSVGVAWTSTDPESALDNLFLAVSKADGELSPVAAFAKNADVDLEGFTTIPGGYRLLWVFWGRSLYSKFMFMTSTADRGGRILQRRTPLGIDWGDLQLSLRPRGGYVAHWKDRHGLFTQLRDEEGRPTVTERTSLRDIAWRDVLHQSDGSFIVVASRYVPGAGNLGVLAHRFDAQGRPIGRWFRLLPPPPTDQSYYREVALGQDGTLAVATALYNQGDISHVTLRIFTSDGVPLVAPVEVTASEPSFPEALAIDPAGRVLLVWAQYSHALQADLQRAQVFARTGEPLGGAFDVASSASTLRSVFSCAKADWAGVDWVIAWLGSGDARAPWQIFLRRFARE